MVPPEKVVALGKELTEAGADWQIHAYGHTRHGFTNPKADGSDRPASSTTRSPPSASWTSFVNFLEELFG